MYPNDIFKNIIREQSLIVGEILSRSRAVGTGSISFEPNGNIQIQEEPKNMGGWQHLLRYEWPFKLNVISRKSSSTPATGYSAVHKKEQANIVDAAIVF